MKQDSVLGRDCVVNMIANCNKLGHRDRNETGFVLALSSLYLEHKVVPMKTIKSLKKKKNEAACFRIVMSSCLFQLKKKKNFISFIS